MSNFLALLLTSFEVEMIDIHVKYSELHIKWMSVQEWEPLALSLVFAMLKSKWQLFLSELTQFLVGLDLDLHLLFRIRGLISELILGEFKRKFSSD